MKCDHSAINAHESEKGEGRGVAKDIFCEKLEIKLLWWPSREETPWETKTGMGA